eukprot:jgi/Orpsp1_1/1180432/evm.model.c7180000073423.1
MVNLRYLSLPLLVGLFASKAKADCVIAGASASACTHVGCSTSNTDDGYYYVDAESEIWQYTGQSGTCTKITEKGIYKLQSGATSLKEIKNDGTIDDYDAVPGYYKDGKNKYFICDGPNVTKCKYIDVPSETCSETNVGKLIKDGSKVGLCLANYKNGEAEYSPLLDFISSSTVTTTTTPSLSTVEDYRYFVQHTKKDDTKEGYVFNFDKDTNYYAVKRVGYFTILFDSAYNSDNGKVECADGKTGQKISTIQDFCSTTSSGKYFVCTDGKCKSYLQSNWEVPEVNKDECVYNE